MKKLIKQGASVVTLIVLLTSNAIAQDGVIVASPFDTSMYDSWNNTFDGVFDGVYNRASTPDWGVPLVGESFLTENTDGFIGDSPSSVDGQFGGFNIINSTGETMPSAYTLSTTLSTYDDDGLGVIFGYQDEDNYFRISTRNSDGSYGHPGGIAVQKVVNGVITQLGIDSSTVPATGGTEYNVSVAVDGSNYTVSYDGTAVLTGSDTDLTAGDYGVYSWAQRSAYFGGTRVHEVTFNSDTVNQSYSFDAPTAVSLKELNSYDEVGAQLTAARGLTSTFQLDLRRGGITENSDNFAYANTVEYTDFLTPAIVVDDDSSSTWTDYTVQARLTSTDDDGLGLVFRVQDDFNFYRLTFCNQANASTLRPLQGVSIQKCVQGSWSNIYTDDQNDPLFVYTPSTPFDVSLTVEGNDISLSIINDPEGEATLLEYPVITDSSLSYGTVGFHTWGNSGANFFGYGGDVDAPLVVEIGYEPQEYTPGDANKDGKVDGSDVTILAGNWQYGVDGQNTATWEMGDFNNDGKVDGSDVTILAGNWQNGVQSSATAVPEPSTVILLMIGALMLILYRRKA